MLSVSAARRPMFLVIATLAIALAALGTRAAPRAARAAPAPIPVVALPGYTVHVFARGNNTFFNPDPVLTIGDKLWVSFQNASAHDGTSGSSTVVEYNSKDGTMVRSLSVPGEVEGLRRDPASGLIWMSKNEDGGAALDTLNPTTGVVTPISLSPTPPAGFDDIYFTEGRVFAVNAHPPLDSSGVNHGAAAFQLQLKGKVATVTEILAGDAQALDTTTNTTVTLNLFDPDSMSADPAGDLVITDQAGAEVVTVVNPGTPQQTVRRAPTAVALDDTQWVPSANQRMYLADSAQNVIYSIDFPFVVGQVYTTSEDLDDDIVARWVGVWDQTTGKSIPVIIGTTKASGLVFGPKP
jgi:sugar lactone lactonase YvrE